MRIRGSLILVVAIAFIAASGQVSARADSTGSGAGIEGESWQPQGQWIHGEQGFLLRDSRGPTSFDGSPKLVANSQLANFQWSDKLCKSDLDPHCSGSERMIYQAPLGVCDGSNQIDCIESLQSIDESGTVTDGTFTEYSIPAHINLYAGDPTHGLPSPQTPGIWSIGGDGLGVISQYALSVVLTGWRENSSCGSCIFGIRTFRAMLAPVSKAYSPPIGRYPNGLVGYNHYFESVSANGIPGVKEEAWISPTGSPFQCAVVVDSTDYCFIQRPFSNELRFRLKIRLHEEPTGWMHGRMKEPSISISNRDSGGVLLQVEAAPTKVPVVYKQTAFNSLPEEMQKLYAECGLLSCTPPGGLGVLSMPENGIIAKDPAARWMVSNPFPFGPKVFQELKLWLPIVGDRSATDQSKWVVQTLDDDQMQDTNPCFRGGKGIKGIVSTNASAYSAGPPVFIDGSLHYKVAAPHFDHTGAVFKGAYTLNVRSDVARCLYSFSSAPIEASVEVISEEGEEYISTNSVQEKDGWLNLNAAGFTFSSPTINVKIVQRKPVIAGSVSPAPVATSAPATPAPVVAPAVTPVVTPAPVVAKPALKSITCVKGKTKKVVKALSPKCPTGYKRVG